MKFITVVLLIALTLIACSCTTGPKANPDGKYGQPVPKEKEIQLADLIKRQGQLLKTDLVIKGTIMQVDNTLDCWFIIKSGNDTIKCTIADFRLPDTLVGKEVYVSGPLEMVEVSKEKGRQPGGEYTFAADPSGAKYEDELRLRAKGVEVIMTQ